MGKLVRGLIGGALTPIVGTVFFAFLVVRNRRKPEGIVALRLRSGQIVPVRIIRSVRGLPKNAQAVTFGRTILTSLRFPSSALLRHELVHVEQYERHGFFGFLVRYGFDAGRNGYENSVMEREARAAQ